MAEVIREGSDALGHHRRSDPEQARSLGTQICDVVAMILKILADFGCIVDEADSEALQVLGGANP